MHCTRVFALMPLWLVALGCGGAAPETPSTSSVKVPELSARFDASRVGEIRGRVVWEGPQPVLPPLQAAIPTGAESYQWTMMPQAYTPAVHPKTHGLANAVVSLRSLDLARSKPWDHPPVRLVQRDYQIRVMQGDAERTVGLVRVGDEVTCDSTDPVQHMLRARGAEWFSVAFPSPNHPITRPLRHPGWVELTSGAGMVWMAADLFVMEHPYAAVTDAEGRFTMTRVPEGNYDLVVWARNWRTTGRDRAPDTGITIRNRYAPPLQKTTPIVVKAGSHEKLQLTVTLAEFEATK